MGALDPDKFAQILIDTIKTALAAPLARLGALERDVALLTGWIESHKGAVPPRKDGGA